METYTYQYSESLNVLKFILLPSSYRILEWPSKSKHNTKTETEKTTRHLESDFDMLLYFSPSVLTIFSILQLQTPIAFVRLPFPSLVPSYQQTQFQLPQLPPAVPGSAFSTLERHCADVMAVGKNPEARHTWPRSWVWSSTPNYLRTKVIQFPLLSHSWIIWTMIEKEVHLDAIQCIVYQLYYV